MSLPPELQERYIRAAERFVEMFEQRFPEFVAPTAPVKARKLTKEEEKVVEEFMQSLDPEIKALAEDLVREEIKDKLRSGYKIDVLKRAVKEKKKPKLKRKRGCIFLQIGEGTPTDPIDEIMIAST